MARKKMTIEEVQAEVERLESSEYIAIWKQSEEQKLRRKMYNLRYLESKGKRFAEEQKSKTPIEHRRRCHMRANLCWSCGRLCKCQKTFPNGRPQKKSGCDDFIDMPPEPVRFTHLEIAQTLGCSPGKVDQLASSANGVKFLAKALARKGIKLTYEIARSRIYFYKEEIRDDR